jgi:hypothetical protein
MRASKRWLAVLAVLGCSSGGGGQPDASPEGSEDAGFVTASHTAMPQATSLGGTVLAAPKLVAISFQNDSPMQPTIDAFAQQMQANTGYFSAATSEYGVGPLTSVTFHSTDSSPATLTDSDVQAWVTNAIQSVTGFPPPDANTIYKLFYPASTTVTTAFGQTCVEFQGYHDSFMMGSQSIIYAVVPRCDAPIPSITLADEMTAEASHEIVEAATDPYPSSTKPAYITVDSASHAWELLAGGEIGDLCAAFPDSFYKPAGFDHLVQRVWSNANAAANHDPCEPQGTSPYFNSAPVLPDMITVSVGGQPVQTQGVKLSPGNSATIELDLYSDMPTSGPWTVSALDITSAFFGGSPALSFSFDTNTGQNGDVIHLTIQSMKAVPGGAPFWIESDLGQLGDGGVFSCLLPNCQATVWLAAVSND